MDNFDWTEDLHKSTTIDPNHQEPEGKTVLLCASCDRCRKRKTKCDGNRPCENCVNKYKKMKKLDSIEGIDLAEFDCVYSPVKRRGPVPGKSSTRKAAEMLFQSYQPQVGFDGTNGQSKSMGYQQQQFNNNSTAQFSTEEMKQMLLLQQQLLLQQVMLQQMANTPSVGNMGQAMQRAQVQQYHDNQIQGNQMFGGDTTNNCLGGTVDLNLNLMSLDGNGQMDPNTLELLQQYQNQLNSGNSLSTNMAGSDVVLQPQQNFTEPSPQYIQEQPTKRAYRVEPTISNNNDSLPRLVVSHLPLLDRFSRDGNLLRTYYELSVNDILNLPLIPSDEEYCNRLILNKYSYTPDNLPTYDRSVLRAARFAELALGALANDQVPLALELSNASVMCMRNCGDGPVDESCMYEVARAYLLHGIFRSFRGDFHRYFKYRRVCMTHVGQLENHLGVEALIAAVSFHDALAYMLHNASEDALPDIDQVLPRFKPKSDSFDENGEVESKYGISTNAKAVAGQPHNQMWMQGAPPVFLNNEANLANRTLDGLACAIRSCCDHANSQFEEMAKMVGVDVVSRGSCGMTSTTKAVMANENELCSRNLVLSSRTLLDQHRKINNEKSKRLGLEMLAMAMDAFLENSGGAGESCGFTEKQVKNLLDVSEILCKNPLFLNAPGPVYHMMSNAAIMLCHILNGMHKSSRETNAPDNTSIEAVLFSEVFEAFMSMRKLLTSHRKTLPLQLRCHGLPQPNIGPFKENNSNDSFIDISDTSLCACRGCQGFVLMGCSPCVAAERSTAASKLHVSESGDSDGEELEREFQDIDVFEMGDDDLLNAISRFMEN